jgi:hypothetical protein
MIVSISYCPFSLVLSIPRKLKVATSVKLPGLSVSYKPASLACHTSINAPRSGVRQSELSIVPVRTSRVPGSAAPASLLRDGAPNR